MTGVWVTRSGEQGERDRWAWQGCYSGGGWANVPDLSDFTSQAAIESLVQRTFETASAGRRSAYSRQLWALRNEIVPGNLIILPMKTTRELALGRVTSTYLYLAEEKDLACRHVVRVAWEKRVPRSTLQQDLLYSLGAGTSIFAISRNRALERVENVLTDGKDPGSFR
ncbi:hypothetical protein IFT79_05315 [Frigoribacterium sp. CFBP 8759]|uniref:restriction endonuclease n=1 Tax=Frigoribacterium sp. CFBP 8759 TaxID=2775283 RepID=UPI00177B5E69|nr:hypothetical protein [Frigoribacterium sp. CFBP 8759]MBD8485030.1 hypothetical protein [Frigoribacterium sp. CFBP 8759]